MNLKFSYTIVAACLAGFLLAGCGEESVKYASIPQAKAVQGVSNGVFPLSQGVEFVFPSESENLMKAASISVEAMEKVTGFKMNVKVSDEPVKNGVSFKFNKDIKPEGFQVTVSTDGVSVEAGDYAGTFYAYLWMYQTLLLQEANTLPCMSIQDYPTTAYRGAMLDVARSFFPVEEVKSFIDMLAMHRLNHFHWHLTDDQGWRIEIKGYPELTRVGSLQEEGSPLRSGFYTQEEIKDIIAYAADRAITVIPEIDLPGHSSAALAAYAKLGCTGGPYAVASQPGGVHKDVLCLGSDFAWKFAKDVLAEVASLFPAPYIHIGGDEVPRDRWKACSKCQQMIKKFGLKDIKGFSKEDLLQGKFNEQMALYLKGLGKKMIGWDEVLSENIDQSTTIMSWRGLGRGTKALKMGHDVIFSSNGHFYFNNYQIADTDKEPESTGGYLPMSKVFDAEWVTKDLTDEQRSKIKGVEACLWTSYVRSFDVLNVKLLPRFAAFSDVAWGNESRDYAEFLDRLPDMLSIYTKSGFKYAPIFFNVNAEFASNTADKSLSISLNSIKGAEIHYTLDGTTPSKTSPKYESPVVVKESCKLQAYAYTKAGLVSNLFEKDVNVNKATFAAVKLLTEPAERYGGNQGKVLVDGVRSVAFHTTGMWTGYQMNPMVALIDLGEVKSMSHIGVSSFTDMGAYIMGIEKITVEVSEDGTHYTQVADASFSAPGENDERKSSKVLNLDFDAEKGRYVKLIINGFGALPKWHSGTGQKPFLFVDEIEIR